MMNQHLTPAIVRQFGIALGLWGYNLDLALNGRGQGDMPDLVAVEESPVYAAILDMIEKQDPPGFVKKRLDGVSVYAEETPSALYLVLREAMFEAYRRAAQADGG